LASFTLVDTSVKCNRQHAFLYNVQRLTFQNWVLFSYSMQFHGAAILNYIQWC